MSNYELEMFYGRRSCKVLDGESVCVCVCVNVSYLHGPEPNEWFYEWNSYQDDTRQLQEMRCSPDKEGDGIWRRNWLRILNTRVLQLPGVDGELPEGDQRGQCWCPRKVRRGMWLVTVLPAGHELFMGRHRAQWKEHRAIYKEAGVWHWMGSAWP